MFDAQDLLEQIYANGHPLMCLSIADITSLQKQNEKCSAVVFFDFVVISGDYLASCG